VIVIGVYVSDSVLLTSSVLNAHRHEEMVCGVKLTFNDYRVISYMFIVIFPVSFIAAIKINFAVSVFGCVEFRSRRNPLTSVA